ncbi:thioredoxin domain-containing protein [Microbacterium sp. LjRoot45]|uniref:thioredoxin domain-containing protein n=1 Tax=Microbacterium sp. LjRoot45 TaxID=3342329 RepID=UPI003ECD34D8
MSTDDSRPEVAPIDRREAVREKAQQVRAQQSRARLARRSALVAGVVVAGVAVIGVVAWTISATAGRPQLEPLTADADGFAISSVAGVVGVAPDVPVDPDAASTPAADATPTPTPTPEATDATAPPVEIRVYVDYLSPGAREWQLANVQQLSAWVEQGAATLTYHPVSMLAAKSNGTKYSLRAASAAACMATYSADDYFNFNNELLSRQPAVDSDGYTDAELADLAIASGADDPKKVRSCIESGDFTTWVKDATERAVAGIPDTDDLALTGIPMILVNGQAYVGALDDPAEFSQFVMTSASDAFYKSQQAEETPSPTPTPTP